MLASEICFMLLEHLARAAASRTFWTAGTSRPIRIAMMAITTSSSISVNAGRERARSMDLPQKRKQSETKPDNERKNEPTSPPRWAVHRGIAVSGTHQALSAALGAAVAHLDLGRGRGKELPEGRESADDRGLSHRGALRGAPPENFHSAL